jgi:hypothetical protein
MGKVVRTDEATGLPIFEKPTVSVSKTDKGYEVQKHDEATGLPIFKKKDDTLNTTGSNSGTGVSPTPLQSGGGSVENC